MYVTTLSESCALSAQVLRMMQDELVARQRIPSLVARDTHGQAKAGKPHPAALSRAA